MGLSVCRSVGPSVGPSPVSETNWNEVIYTKIIQYYEPYINNNIVEVPQLHSNISIGRSVGLSVSNQLVKINANQ